MAWTPLPPPLMVSEPGSFAEYTIVRRKPQIISDVIDQNTYTPAIVAELRNFAQEIVSSPIAPLEEDAEDVAIWRTACLPWQGKTWRQLPWYLAETYFYRRLLEIVRYFQPGPWYHLDPFAPQKQETLAGGLDDLASFITLVPQGLSAEEHFTLWLHRSLWGNRADLSNIEVMTRTRSMRTDNTSPLLVIDHTQQVWRLLARGGIRRIDLAADNSGLELLSDLCLLDMLLSQRLVENVHIHLKPQPFFVSDAIRQDLADTIAGLRQAAHPFLQTVGARLQTYQDAGQLIAQTHPFWASSRFFKQFPQELAETLSQADLIVLKGDVNYRRLLEDRHWPHTASLATIAHWMPSSFLALRTLKGELIVGLPEGMATALAGKDPTWLINGKRGLIHLVEKKPPIS